MRTIAMITILTGLIIGLSALPSYSHGVNWGLSVNLGLPVYAAPVYPAYPVYAYPPAPVYPAYGGVVVGPGYRYPGRYYRPYHPYYHRYYRR
jgi:hypothetical protein